MSPLLFVIFFSDVISELEKVQLEAGTVMLGPLALFAILFADDLVVLARTIKDLQQLSGIRSCLVNTLAKNSEGEMGWKLEKRCPEPRPSALRCNRQGSWWQISTSSKSSAASGRQWRTIDTYYSS